jgi:hypothetical protein
MHTARTNGRSWSSMTIASLSCCARRTGRRAASSRVWGDAHLCRTTIRRSCETCLAAIARGPARTQRGFTASSRQRSGICPRRPMSVSPPGSRHNRCGCYASFLDGMAFAEVKHDLGLPKDLLTSYLTLRFASRHTALLINRKRLSLPNNSDLA